MSMRVMLLTLGLLAGGCMFQNLSAANRFNEHVFVLNDSARWGRLDVAIANVDPEYRQQYATRHQLWGKGIEIAEADVVRMQVDEDKDGAMSQVVVSWYDKRDLTLRTSTISQRWRADGQAFFLVEEKLDGDMDLFAKEASQETAAKTPEAEPKGEGAGGETKLSDAR